MKKCSYCGRESDDILATCRECGTPLPQERPGLKPHQIAAFKTGPMHTRALFQGMWQALFSVGVLVVGWLYPVWSLGRDPTTRHDTDTRLGPAFLFSMVVGFVFAILAVRSFRRACRRELPPLSK
jgi:hypothetical protein